LAAMGSIPQAGAAKSKWGVPLTLSQGANASSRS